MYILSKYKCQFSFVPPSPEFYLICKYICSLHMIKLCSEKSVFDSIMNSHTAEQKYL